MIKKFVEWFTPERRQGFQALAASVASILVIFGVGHEDTWRAWLLLLGVLLQLAAQVSNIVYLEAGQWSKGWEIVRGALYTAAGAALPVFVTLGFLTDTLSAQIMSALGIGLSILGNLVAIVAGSAQEEYKFRQEVSDGQESDGEVSR